MVLSKKKNLILFTKYETADPIVMIYNTIEDVEVAKAANNEFSETQRVNKAFQIIKNKKRWKSVRTRIPKTKNGRISKIFQRHIHNFSRYGGKR